MELGASPGTSDRISPSPKPMTATGVAGIRREVGGDLLQLLQGGRRSSTDLSGDSGGGMKDSSCGAAITPTSLALSVMSRCRKCHVAASLPGEVVSGRKAANSIPERLRGNLWDACTRWTRERGASLSSKWQSTARVVLKMFPVIGFGEDT